MSWFEEGGILSASVVSRLDIVLNTCGLTSIDDYEITKTIV